MEKISYSLEELVDPRHSALIVVDMQNDFCHPDGAFAKRGTDISMVQRNGKILADFITQARNHGLLICHTQDTHGKTDSPAWNHKHPMGGICIDGTWGREFWEEHKEFTPLSHEHVITKYRYCGFTNTRMDQVLRAHRIKTVILTGTTTETCVETTARGAYMRDYFLVIPQDCVASPYEEYHRVTLKILGQLWGTVSTSDEIVKIWDRAKLPHALAK